MLNMRKETEIFIDAMADINRQYDDGLIDALGLAQKIYWLAQGQIQWWQEYAGDINNRITNHTLD